MIQAGRDLNSSVFWPAADDPPADEEPATSILWCDEAPAGAGTEAARGAGPSSLAWMWLADLVGRAVGALALVMVLIRSACAALLSSFVPWCVAVLTFYGLISAFNGQVFGRIVLR